MLAFLGFVAVAYSILDVSLCLLGAVTVVVLVLGDQGSYFEFMILALCVEVCYVLGHNLLLSNQLSTKLVGGFLL